MDKEKLDMPETGLNNILIFTPYYKTVIWGGRRIAALKKEEIGIDNLGESWEISAIPGHESRVAAGKFEGRTIQSLIAEYGETFLGKKVVDLYGDEFPLLLKFIDAHRDLSLQVHPSDQLAKERHNSRGKVEMWYVVDADRDAKIYCGLKASLTPADYRVKTDNKTIMDVVKVHDSHQGQAYVIPPGTLHAIGEGNLVAEVQESSDITYRVYDYDRYDSGGKPRALHTDLAIDAIDYTYPKEIHPTAYTFEGTEIEAVKCRYFTVDYLEIDGEGLHFECDGQSFVCLMVVGGKVKVTADGEVRELTIGHSALIPASVAKLDIEGSGRVLKVYI